MAIALENFRAAPVQQLELGGIPLSCRVFGAGPALLFLHGWPLCGATYRGLIEALAQDYRCYVPDLPGAGSTAWSPRIGETMRGYAGLMQAFVEQLQLDQLAIIGHDSGAGVARLLAAELGDRVTCLILQNTELPDHMPFAVRTLQLLSRSRLTSAALGAALQSKLIRRSPLGFGGTFVDRSLIEGEFHEACLQPILRDISGATSAMAHLDCGWTRSLNEVHARIAAPIHLFWGERDRLYFPIEPARAMAATFRRKGEFKAVANGSLYVHEEAADELARFCAPLLQQAFARGKAAPAHAAS
jgi:haloalkane dehalogenase